MCCKVLWRASRRPRGPSRGAWVHCVSCALRGFIIVNTAEDVVGVSHGNT